MIALPEQIAGLPLIVSMSGGKDSTATALALKEAGLAYTMVFADTGWEAPETYDHLDMLMTKLGPIDVVRGLGMVAEIMKRKGFPSRMQRWCTRKLKIEPLRKYHDAIGDDTVSVVGVRSGESEARKNLPELEDDARWGGWIWRPLITWTVADVLAIHHRHGVPVNPLYLKGHDRVGCHPCIYENKGGVALLPAAKIDEIRQLERDVRELRGDDEGRFFQSAPIDEVVAWSKTSRGGRQLPLLQPPPEGGCFRWGLCEPPADDDKDAA